MTQKLNIQESNKNTIECLLCAVWESRVESTDANKKNPALGLLLGLAGNCVLTSLCEVLKKRPGCQGNTGVERLEVRKTSNSQILTGIWSDRGTKKL